jgi:hypothetical protein
VSFQSSAARLALFVAVAAACSHPAPPATPASGAAGAQPAAAQGQTGMSGDWGVQLIPQGQEPNMGVLSLVPSGEGYTGNLRLDAANRPYFVRSVQVQGNHIVIIIDTPDGDARIEGNMRAPTQFEGMYTSRTLNGRFIMTHR